MPKKQLIVTGIALLLVLTITASSYAENFLEYKRVVLCAIHMTALVNRFTGEVKYILQNDGHLKLLKGTQKHQCQSMYDAQIKLKLKCD
jgi:hypothetical protein